jgi:hypothetical protein
VDDGRRGVMERGADDRRAAGFRSPDPLKLTGFTPGQNSSLTQNLIFPINDS